MEARSLKNNSNTLSKITTGKVCTMLSLSTGTESKDVLNAGWGNAEQEIL